MDYRITDHAIALSDAIRHLRDDVYDDAPVLEPEHQLWDVHRRLLDISGQAAVLLQYLTADEEEPEGAPAEVASA